MTRSLSILMLNHNPQGSGTYFRCLHFARHLVRRGHHVTLLTGGTQRFRSYVQDIEGVHVIATPRFRRLALLLAPGWLDTGFLSLMIRSGHALSGRYDIIHGFDHLPSVSIPSYVGRRLRGTCFISDWCDWWSRGGFPVERFTSEFRNRMEAQLEEGIRRVADGVTTISTVLRDRAIDVGVAPERVSVVPSGADIDGIVPGDQAAARRKLGLPTDAKILGFAGFVDQDVDVVLGAVKRLGERFPEARAMVVGMSEFARATATRLDMLDNVILPGVRPYSELSDYFAASDVLALPLRDTLFNRARWPNKLGDYLAAGRPTVTSPIGDIRHLFEQHEIGLLAAPDDIDDFATQVGRLFADPALAVRMGTAARRLGEGEYSWERMTDAMEAFYHVTLEHFDAGRRA